MSKGHAYTEQTCPENYTRCNSRHILCLYGDNVNQSQEGNGNDVDAGLRVGAELSPADRPS